MQLARKLLMLGALLGAALVAAGCGRRVTPADKCHEYRAEWDAALRRCGVTTGITLLHPVTGDPVSCDNVGSVNNITEVETVCYPWLRSATCAELATPIPECSAMHFEILVDG